MAYRPIVVFLLVPALFLASSAGAEVEQNLGISGGFPQMIALTYQAEVARFMSLEAYLGCLAYLNTTLGGRVILGSTSPGLRPRCFAGIAMVDQHYADKPGDPEGVEFYPWTGVGLSYEFDNGFQIFGDFVYIGKGAGDRGFGNTSPSLSFCGGLLFRL